MLIPSYSYENEQGKLIVARKNDGHFYLYAKGKSDKKILFLVDTGASDIALTKKDAITLGVNVNNLNYDKRYHTANGVVFSAPVTIPEFTIGKKTFYNIKAHVSSGGLGTPLLGMSLIEEFTNFSISRDLLILEY